MIHYYLYKPSNKFVDDNDLEFSIKVNSINWDSEKKKVLSDFEGVKLDHTFPKYVISKYGGDSISLYEISSGCKTILNVINDPSKIYSLNECGRNAINYLYSLHVDINVYADNVILGNNLQVELSCHLLDKVLPPVKMIDVFQLLDKEGFYGCVDD